MSKQIPLPKIVDAAHLDPVRQLSCSHENLEKRAKEIHANYSAVQIVAIALLALACIALVLVPLIGLPTLYIAALWLAASGTEVVALGIKTYAFFLENRAGKIQRMLDDS